MKYDIEWVKDKIIIWLDEHYEDACWYNMVLWTLKLQTFKETFGTEGNWREQSCCEEHGGAYCGKCVRMGRLKE